jgi:hypothetical protein
VKKTTTKSNQSLLLHVNYLKMIIDRQQQSAWDKIVSRAPTVATNGPSPPPSSHQVPASPRSQITEISLGSIPPTYQESQQLQDEERGERVPRLIGVGRYRVDVREQESRIEPESNPGTPSIRSETRSETNISVPVFEPSRKHLEISSFSRTSDVVIRSLIPVNS